MYLLLFANALLLSAIAAYYSVFGLIAIFAAATVPVAIMGGSLEIAKLVIASWLYRYWRDIPMLMRTYFTIALVLLMLITSMGIFGYLSKAHLDQAVPVGDVVAKLNILDEKISTEKDNITASREAIKQLNQAVDQVMGRSTDEKGAEKAVQIRRAQQAERAKLLKEIEQAQKRIAVLNEERAPIAAEVRKVEAEVGPIKYIAAMIYGDDADSNTLEKAVRGLIIILIVVFDPLAVLMLIAANLTQVRNSKTTETELPEPTPPAPQVPIPTPEPEPVKPIEEIVLEWPDANSVIVAQEPTSPVQVQEATIQPVELATPPVVLPVALPEEQPKRRRKPKEQTVEDTYKGSNNVSMDFNSQVDNMISTGDAEGLEVIYKKIVKELGKKNRAKTTHWGPLKSSK
jgi:hypothetical protein